MVYRWRHPWWPPTPIMDMVGQPSWCGSSLWVPWEQQQKWEQNMYQKQRIFVSLVQTNNILEQPLEDEPSLRSMSRRKSKCGRLRSTEYHSLPILSLMQPSQLSPTVSLATGCTSCEPWGNHTIAAAYQGLHSPAFSFVPDWTEWSFRLGMWVLGSPLFAMVVWDWLTQQPCPLSTPSHCAWRQQLSCRKVTLGTPDNSNNPSSHHCMQNHANNKRRRLLPNCRPDCPDTSCWTGQWKGYSWVAALPVAAHGFALRKSAFCYALYYNWTPADLPRACACGAAFTTEQTLTCPTGGFTIIRHNEVHDHTANLTEVCNDVCAEPHLQPLLGETLSTRSATTEDNAWLDVAASGFWVGRFESAYAPSNRTLPTATCYRCHEHEKRCTYEEWIW